MIVDNIQLSNFKSYDADQLAVDRGVTVVYGVNGSGKSTLLEAVFFALYGAKALDDRTLDDVITTGSDRATVELEFTHAGNSYHLERQLRRRGDRASTSKCVLETPNETIEGARNVRAEIVNLLRMDADSFVNCAYVRQGEVNKLIHASPNERQDMIDELLQLGVLETYRERASDARLGVKTVLDGKQEVLDSITQQIEAKEEKGLYERLNELESEKSTLSSKIDRYETQREEARQTLDEAKDVLDRHDEIQTEVASLEDEIESLQSAITNTEDERAALKRNIRSLSDRRETTVETARELVSDRDSPEDSTISSRIENVLSRTNTTTERRNEIAPDGEPTATQNKTDDHTPSGTSRDILDDLEDHIETLEADDSELRDRLEDIRTTITEQTATIRTLRERADDIDETIDEIQETIAELESKIADGEQLIDERRETHAELDAEITAKRSQFESAPIDFGEADTHRTELENEREELLETRSSLEANIESTKTAIETGESLLDEGKCPECGQPVHDSPHVDVLDDRREELASLKQTHAEIEEQRENLDDRIERAIELHTLEQTVDTLETKRETVSQLIDEQTAALSERRERIESLRERVSTLQAEASEKRSEANTIEESVEQQREKLGEINAERAEIKEALETRRELTSIITDVRSIDTEIEQYRNARVNKYELNEERRDRLSEKRDRLRELEAEFDDNRIELAKTQREKAKTYLEKVASQLEALNERREKLENAIGGVTNELEELEKLRTRYDAVETERSALESLYAEVETVQQTYGELRAELRQRNVETLERLVNETFDLIYQNDAYAAIELDGDYRLTVYQKDGKPLDPEHLSGGERALFNLSLRCAIYRLLAESVDGATPMPPLILDEPTVFLDAGHVTKLVSLIESMRRLGVEQIVVVSHDEELVGAADSVVHVEKDPTSNRSQLTRDIEPLSTIVPPEPNR